MGSALANGASGASFVFAHLESNAVDDITRACSFACFERVYNLCAMPGLCQCVGVLGGCCARADRQAREANAVNVARSKWQ